MNQAYHPLLYQINTRVWLRDLSRKLNRPATLDDIPEEALHKFAHQGFEWIYLLGVWQTGEAARKVSLAHPGWRAEYQKILQDFTEKDVTGSCFAVTGYTVHEQMGGNRAMERLHERLKGHNLRLMLDFVPNHTAPDHPWVNERPDFFIDGTEANLENEPQNYTRIQTEKGARVLAYGRDPYFSGWPDTLQLDYSNVHVQAAMMDEMLCAAQLSDGLCCDMAMLVLPEIFQRTWGRQAEPFWPKAIDQVRQAYPGFVFMAEVYWDLELTLQQQGFDFTYDKRLYDRLREQHAVPVRGHLQASHTYLHHMAHFLENHDEPRTAATLSPEIHRAAAVVTFFGPGMRFFHQGQFEGHKVHISVHLNRRPQEPENLDLHGFYKNLLKCLRKKVFQCGTLRILDASPAWEGNWTNDCFITYLWQGPRNQQWLVVVNYSPNQSQCYLHVPLGNSKKNGITFQEKMSSARYERETSEQCYLHVPLGDSKKNAITFRDKMSSARYERETSDLESHGLFLDMPPWGYHVFHIVDNVG